MSRLEVTEVATQVRAPMPPSRRAKIFSMFDALKGLKEAIAAKEKIPEARRELAPDAIEELNQTLSALEKGQVVTVVFYCSYEQAYTQLTGPVTRIEPYWKLLYVGNVGIDFCEIAGIIVIE